MGDTDEELHRHAVEDLERADALLFGRMTYGMMEAAFRGRAHAGAQPAWTEPFAWTIDAARKYVVSSAGHGPTLFAGPSQYLDVRLLDRQEFGSGAVALRYEPRT